ncbi:MAG: signal recognition particle protein [Pyramidobacter sp.]|nr:signal recognition particle protein [Pyramidobacter sp.]MBP3751900.1 signal recognition particle protein [Pyramidobacter sp.]MBQ4489912.1 signal recognition particle protein [Pyramidobacter sp.]MBQ9424278.1 signal recognition particle protein [Pyramidobacter sp.]
MFDALKERLEGIFKNLRGRGKLTEDDVQLALREIRRALLEADVNYKVVKDLVEKIRVRAVGDAVLNSITPAQQVSAIVYEEIARIMGEGSRGIDIASQPPTLVMMVGLQGGGKTTSSAKLAKKLSKGHKPMLVACDLRRPAAVQQLQVLAAQAGVAFFGPEPGETDIVALSKRALAYAASHLIDVLIFDTAGRLAIDEEMMAELDRMKAALNPHEILLVVDAMSGQEALNVAEAFNSRLSVTGVVLSKLDGDARGGAALAVLAATGVPVKFAGVGEGIDAIEQFDPRRMAERIMGMGDMAGLVEKIREATTEADVMHMAESIKKARFTMDDMLAQFEQIQKMGPLEKVMEMLPGEISSKVKDLPPEALDARRLLRMKAIIQSMTKAERSDPAIIKGSRRRRIAQGSGTTVQMVNQLIKQHAQMAELMKRMGRLGKKRGLMSSLGGMFRR